ncbi:MAG: hypothetical protein QHC67_04290 [Sphingobium sp.]|uniref:hypothetical protein n=1 Tax=Sphingobium sp. TaxID=1912891 RepID=UPI0029B93A0F|nr:hypothetical protein [Sphingobium sp.]MDX3909020.1 hypothetical protein [Sphingobium sp.]
MPSDRMMEAIGRMERAMSRIEQAAEECLRAPTSPTIDRAEAEAALQSLDALIADLKGTAHG